MAHELDFTRGQAAIAFRGQTPWHGLGESILAQDTVDDIRLKAGLDYDVVKTPVKYQRNVIDIQHGSQTTISEQSNDHCVLYRSDSGGALSVVSPKYQVVQPRQVIEFYRDLTEKYGFQLEVVGALKGGRKVWALANTGDAFQLRDRDEVKGYLLLATSYDGSMATQARFTSVRVVCNNTLTLADSQGRAEVSVPHSTAFDADKVKLELKIGDAWAQFEEQAKLMTTRVIGPEETMKFLLEVYYGLDSKDKIQEFQGDEKNNKSAEKFITRMQQALFNSPGAHLASAKGTLWGVLNAVTHDVDFSLPSRTADTRLDKSWFGTGAAIKQKAWTKALSLVS